MLSPRCTALATALALSAGPRAAQAIEHDWLPETIEYARGETIPPGYQVTTRPQRGLFVTGTVTLASVYGLTALGAAVQTVFAQDYWGASLAPAFVPVVGPFIAAGTIERRGGETYVLVLDGLIQTASLAVLIAAVTNPEEILELQDPSPYELGKAEMPPRRVMSYDKGPIPPGYHFERIPNTAMLKGGAVGLGATYLASAVVAGWQFAEPSDGSGLWPLFIPIAGPFVTMGTTNARLGKDSEAAVLLVDGVGQVVCLGLMVAGAYTERRLLVRDDVKLSGSLARPEVDVGLGSFTLRWRM